MRISDWSSDVCSSDLMAILRAVRSLDLPDWAVGAGAIRNRVWDRMYALPDGPLADIDVLFFNAADTTSARSEEHTSELQSLMRISYAVFCLKKKKHKHTNQKSNL